MRRIRRFIRRYKKIIGLKSTLILLYCEIMNKKIKLKIRNSNISEDIVLRYPSSDIWVYQQVFIHKEYEFTTITSPKVIVDAGANVGYASIYFANLYPDAKIFAIEPENNNFEILCENIKNYKNIIPIQGALWNENSEINICDEGLGEWGFMTFSSEQPQHIVKNMVQGYTIDFLIQKYNLEKIDILKIDIEGAEKEVFEDTTKWINDVDSLIVELHDRMKAGCSRSFYNNTPNFQHEWTRGENIYLSKGNILN